MRKQTTGKLNFDSDEVVLIITGCIRPNQNQRFLVLKDDNERLQQYVSSICFYITNSPFTKIVFCDNSNYPYKQKAELVELAQSQGKIFEWLAFEGNQEKIQVQGKGYGEGEIIRYALMHSELAAKACSFAKVTGRLIISNIGNVIQRMKPNINYFNRDIYRGHGKDTRFYLCNIEFYKENLVDGYLETCELPGKECAIEDIFYARLHRNKHCRNFMAFPAFQGCSGGNGRDYSKVPRLAILFYSVLCRMNLFDSFYVIILALKKMRLVLTGQ